VVGESVVRISVDREKCISAGTCAFLAPLLFDQDLSDGRVVVLTETVDRESAELALEVATHCPSGAIVVLPECVSTGVTMGDAAQ
jgi:ferredoxin